MPEMMQRLWDSAKEDGCQFIESIEKLFLDADINLPYFVARFHAGNFSADLFRMHAIDFPTGIRRCVPKRQAEFIAGRLCARLALSAHGYSHHSVAIGKNREPIWPNELVGSIAHNGYYAAAVVYPKTFLAGIGIDIETVIDEKTRDAMTSLVVSAEELDYLHSGTPHLALDCLLTLVFSAKESFFKAAFGNVKRYFDFAAIRMFEIDTNRRTIQFRSTQALSDEVVADQVYRAYYEFLDGRSVFTAVMLNSDL